MSEWHQWRQASIRHLASSCFWRDQHTHNVSIFPEPSHVCNSAYDSTDRRRRHISQSTDEKALTAYHMCFTHYREEGSPNPFSRSGLCTSFDSPGKVQSHDPTLAASCRSAFIRRFHRAGRVLAALSIPMTSLSYPSVHATQDTRYTQIYRRLFWQTGLAVLTVRTCNHMVTRRPSRSGESTSPRAHISLSFDYTCTSS